MPSLPQRPWVRSDVPLAWRDETTIQVGDAARAVVIADIERDAVAWLMSLAGDRNLGEALAAAEANGVCRSSATRLLRGVISTGLVDDAAETPRALREAEPTLRRRLDGELAAVRHVHGDISRTHQAIERRLSATVAIHGDGIVADAVALALSQAGIGNVVRERRLSSSARRTRRVGARRSCHVLCDAMHPDVAADPDAMALDLPHLPVTAFGARAVIGPFVVPGLSSCLRCRDLHRTDRDPAWPRMAVQWQHRRAAIPPIDSALATVAAAWAALQVMAWVEASDIAGDSPLRWPEGWPREASPTIDGELTITLPGGHVTRAARPAHPLCGCRWPRA